MSATGSSPNLPPEPTVWSSMSRHRVLMACVVLAAVALAVAYSLLRPQEYRATATISAPRPTAAVEQTDSHYLDSQVLLMGTSEVANRAFDLVTRSDARTTIERADFTGTDGTVEVIPPVADVSGAYGTTVITVTFTAPDPFAAQAGANALVTAYDEARTAQITTHARARLAGIDLAISEAESGDDLPGLRALRAQAIIEQQTDLSSSPTMDLAEVPTEPAQRGLLSTAGVGLGLGIVAGGGAAYARARRLGHVGERDVAARVYDAPLLFESSEDLTAEPQHLLARAVKHRLALLHRDAVVAVVAPRQQARTAAVTAGLALALTDDSTVLAVDADGGTAGSALRTLTGARPQLTVLELDPWAEEAPWAASRQDIEIVVVACPPPAHTARAVELLDWCDAAVVLVGADEPVEDHLAMARWLSLTATEVLGFVFTPASHHTWWVSHGSQRRAHRRA